MPDFKPESRLSPSDVRSILHAVEHDRQHYDIYQQHKYVCGHCGTTVSGWVVATAEPDWKILWLLCPECGNGSVLNYDEISPLSPSQPPFPDIGGLPDGIGDLYDEARRSLDTKAYTGCEMLCRKILMNAAVDKEAEPNRKFADYVDYLGDNGYVTPPLKDMAKIVKDNGNDAAHEIDKPDMERAEQTLALTRRILDTIYGVEHELGKYHGNQTGRSGAD